VLEERTPVPALEGVDGRRAVVERVEVVVADQHLVDSDQVLLAVGVESVDHSPHVGVGLVTERPANVVAETRTAEERQIEATVPRFAIKCGEVVAVAVEAVLGELADCTEERALVWTDIEVCRPRDELVQRGRQGRLVGPPSAGVQDEEVAEVVGKARDGDDGVGVEPRRLDVERDRVEAVHTPFRTATTKGAGVSFPGFRKAVRGPSERLTADSHSDRTGFAHDPISLPDPRVPSTTEYLHLVAQNQTVSEIAKQNWSVCIDVPRDGKPDVFRISAADDVLRLLADAHDTEFTIPELVEATGVTRSTVWRAVELLSGLGAVRVRKTPERNYVSIDPDRLEKDDPILAIEQVEFHAPVRTFVQRIREEFEGVSEVDDLVGVVVFGSVARGDADRRSDIDLLVVVDGDRTSARRTVTDVVADLRDRRFDGDRFEFEPYVESVESAKRARSKLGEIFDEGITVYDSGELSTIRKEVFGRE